MQITVTTTSTTLRSLLSTSGDLALAESNRASSKGYNVTIYNADSTSTDIIYITMGETATASEGIPVLAPASSTSTSDPVFIQVFSLEDINLISNAASTTVNILITPIIC